jgi:hypothetical protein
MWKNVLIVVLLMLCFGYFLADKPIVHTHESTDSNGKTRKITINILLGVGNTINYNYKETD